MGLAGLLLGIIKIGLPITALLAVLWWVYRQGYKSAKNKEWKKAEALYYEKLKEKLGKIHALRADPNALYKLLDNEAKWDSRPPGA